MVTTKNTFERIPQILIFIQTLAWPLLVLTQSCRSRYEYARSLSDYSGVCSSTRKSTHVSTRVYIPPLKHTKRKWWTFKSSAECREVYTERKASYKLNQRYNKPLQFRVHPPTTMNFVRSYLDAVMLRMMLPSMVTSEQQPRAAVSSYQFATAPASVIG